MAKHSFKMRLSCRYERPDNTVAKLTVENLEDNEWQDFELDFTQPGFLIFVYAIFNCQHLYMRTNAAERGLLLDTASGSIDVVADNDWVLQKLHVRFEARLEAGNPTSEDKGYIIDRMQHCPVSMNIKDIADSRTLLDFVVARAG